MPKPQRLRKKPLAQGASQRSKSAENYRKYKIKKYYAEKAAKDAKKR